MKIKKKTFFIAGQSGNGKSTALNLLTKNHKQFDDLYNFKYIAGRSIFFI